MSSPDPIATVLPRLECVKKTAKGWKARCPAHDDAHPSLEIGVGDDGRVLLVCRAQRCSAESIVSAIGLSMSDLFPPRESSKSRLPGKKTNAQSHAATGKVYATPEDAIAGAGRLVKGGRLTRAWRYFNPARDEVMRVARFDLADGSKEFRPIHRNCTGWKIGDPPGKLPLYRWPELPATGRIVVTEGEKAADLAASIGFASTASAHGSSAAHKSDWSALAALDVLILPDADTAGAKYAADVAAILSELDPPAKVKIVRLPGLPEHGDIEQFLELRDSRTAEEIVAEIEALAGSTEESTAPAAPAAGPVVTCLAHVEAAPVDWLWRGHFPRGCISVLAGRPGEGKSFATADWAARISTGTSWPDGDDCQRGSIILVSAEDPPEIIRGRLDAHHADVRRVFLLSAVRRIDEAGKPRDVMFTLADLPALELVLQAHQDCLAVIVDPVGSFIGGGIDSHRDNEVRSVLGPLAAMAQRYGVAVLLVAHVRKALSTVADDAVLGSRAFTGIARAVWHLTHDPQDRRRRLLLPGKLNLCAQPDGLAFTIAGEPPVLNWEKEPVRMHADDLAGEANPPGPEPEAREAAQEWLKHVLAAGAVPSGDKDNPDPGTIRALAQEADMKWATVRRAADKLGVRRERDAFTKKFTWRLPRTDVSGLVAQPEQHEKPEQHEQQEITPEK